MPNQITENGIEIMSLEEIRDLIINGDDNTPGLRQIYGEDAVFDSDSPDGQLVGIFSQAVRDLEELILQVYNSFDPDKAVGVSLDARCAYNGVWRKGAGYTIVPVKIENGDKEMVLMGLNDLEEGDENLFTVYDAIGNEFYLMNTETLPANSTLTFSFQAKDIGAVYVAPNTITRWKVTNVGIISVSNPNEPFVIGQDGETSEQERIRRNKAVGYGLLGGVEVMNKSLLQLNNVTDVAIFENNTDTVDTSPEAGGNFPAHCVWIVVEGGDVEEIANVIFLRLNVGCAMKTTADSVTVSVETIQGHYQDIYFNRPLYEPILVRISAAPKNSKAYLNPAIFKPEFMKKVNFSIYKPASTTEIDLIANEVQDDYSYYDIDVVRRADAQQVVTSQDIDYTAWTGITDGALKVNINDGLEERTFGGLDFSSVTSIADIVTILNTAITGYGTVTKVDDTLQFTSATPGTDANFQSFLPVKYDGVGGTNLLPLLGTLKKEWDVQEGDWKELMFPETYQHKFTLDEDSIILTKTVWGA